MDYISIYMSCQVNYNIHVFLKYVMQFMRSTRREALARAAVVVSKKVKNARHATNATLL